MTALAAVLTGCGDSGDGGGEDGGDFAGQSADKIAEAAKDAMGDLTGVTIDGTLSSDDQVIDIEMSIGEGGNCSGSFGTQGATAEILGVDDTTWFRPDEAFWELSAGPEAAPQIIAAVGDKWVTLPADDTSFKPFCDLEEFLGELIDDKGAKYEKGELKEIDGEETIEIISDRPEQGTSSGYVLVDGDHYLVSIVKEEGEDPGEVTFSGFNEQPDVEAPAEDEQISLDELESGGY
ncbi:hypothetical protein GCM10027448_08040 [Nocardioides dilutus]